MQDRAYPRTTAHRIAQTFGREITDATNINMPHPISNCVFARTSLTTCDVFIMALGYLDAHNMPSPEQFTESVSPWFLDAETVWWRKFWMGVG